jgi:gamma-glutamyltranspeptidase/glutathione hydrolase
MSRPRGVVAAGHSVTAETGAAVMRDGGNAVDAAITAVLASFTCEPLLTGLGAGGYMLVAGPGQAPVLFDFMVEAPGRGAPAGELATLVPVDVSFGDASQVFNVGPASVGTYGLPAGICHAARRFGSRPMAELAGPAIALARDGVPLGAQQAYVVEILAGICVSTPELAALFAPGGELLREGAVFRNPDLADALELLAAEGARPFYEGEVASAILEWLEGQGSALTAEDLAAYEPRERAPVRTRYRGRDVFSNPPPSAGGTLIAYALSLLERIDGPPAETELVDVMEAAQDERTPEFLEGLSEVGFLDRFFASRLGSTTHISALDSDGWACGVTCSNGEGSGVVVPGTGIHLNNMMGEEDLNPLGFHAHPPGRRVPSMMSPTIVMRSGVPELVLGSAGSNRIRSAVTQTIVNVVDRGLGAQAAVEAPRLHFEGGVVYVEPGVDTDGLEAAGRTISRFRAENLFFGGANAVERSAAGELSGGGDPRRGGVVAIA